jgi:hypothetical protein
VLVFAHHSAMLDALAAGPLAAVRHVRVDGTVTGTARDRAIAAFQGDSAVRCALLSITAAGVGITLTRASRVVFAELSWNPGALRQCEDRAHRVGQSRAVHVQYLIAADTLDPVMWKTLASKLSVAAAAVDGDVAHGGAIEELRVAPEDAELDAVWAEMEPPRSANGRKRPLRYSADGAVDLTLSEGEEPQPSRAARRRGESPPCDGAALPAGRQPRGASRRSGESLEEAIELE